MSMTRRKLLGGIGVIAALPWLHETGRADAFAVSQLPLPALDDALVASVRATGQLVVVEEHAARGGLAEHLAAALATAGVAFRLHHHHSAGYPTGRYGSKGQPGIT